MNPKHPVAVVAIFSFLVVMGLSDIRMRIDNSQLAGLHTQEAAFTDQAVTRTLTEIRNNCAGNAMASVAARELEAAYENSPQTVVGLTAYKDLATQTQPRIVGPLIEPNRSEASGLFQQLDNIVERHTMSLTSKETAEQNVAGGLFTKVRRDWGFLPSS